MTTLTIAKSVLLSTTLLLSTGAASAAELNIYTTREPGLIQPLLDAFTAATGTKVNTVFLKDGLASSASRPRATARRPIS